MSVSMIRDVNHALFKIVRGLCYYFSLLSRFSFYTIKHTILFLNGESSEAWISSNPRV